MTATPVLLAPSGLPLRRFGGDTAWRQYDTRGFVVSLEWDEDGEPMVAIWPQSGDINRGAWGVCLSAFPHMVDDGGRPTREGMAMVARGLVRMGRDVTVAEVIALYDVALDAYCHLVRVPPKRVDKDTGMFDATATVNGEVVHERSI